MENLNFTVVNNTKKISLFLAALWVLMLVVPVRALDPKEPAKLFLHTHFTTDNGLPAAVVDETVQTKDGFLWLRMNGNNLIRFDGKNFYRFHNPRPDTMAVAPDGALWVGTSDGLIRIPPSSFNQFTFSGLVSYQPGSGKANEIISLHFSRSGVLWIGTAAGLFRFERDQFTAVGPRVATHSIKEAPDGHLLVFTDEGFTKYAGSEVVPHALAAELGVTNKDIFDVVKDKQGNIWYCTSMGVARETKGRIEKLGSYARQGQQAMRAFEDPQGNIWFAKDGGLFRATAAGLELVIPQIQVRSLYSDRDGNLWVGTNGDGLYKLKERGVRMFTTDDGLPNNVLTTVLAARDGTIWTGANCGGITQFDGTRFRTYDQKHGLADTCIRALAEDLNHNLWVGTRNGGAFQLHNGVFTRYTKGQGLPDDWIRSIIAARDGSVWFATGSGLTRLHNGQFRTFTKADGLATDSIGRVFEDRSGVIWAGTRQGLDRLVGDRFEHFATVPTGLALPFGADRDGGLFFQLEIDSEAVTHRLDKDRSDIIKQITACDMVETAQGELWLAGDGIGRIQPGNFAAARRRDEPLDYEAFSIADGLATGEATGPGRNLALTPDGKLYAATPKGLAQFDLSRLPISHSKPSIYLTDITVGRNTQPAGGDIVLPPGTNHVEIHFAAVEISAPEKIRMQYRLEGVDSEWLDAPANPVAIYSNIPIGTRALHIRACNRNGIWDRQGVVFSITQQPYFYQTRWFLAVMLALGILLLFLIYRLRVAQISRQLSTRFDERLAERTRVAREIHDTLLQTVQGSKMVADHALKSPDDQMRMLRAMEQLSTWLAQATEEGRAALHSLRASTTNKNDLAEAFRRAIDECGRGSETEISFALNGDFTELHPVVRDEIYRIGYEALRNACAHSGASRVDVILEYGHDLTLRINDNGMGIDPAVVDNGKEGHFGLRGMRERAERIASKFNLVSSPSSGTVITLVVPGRIAFRTARRNRYERIKSLFTRH